MTDKSLLDELVTSVMEAKNKLINKFLSDSLRKLFPNTGYIHFDKETNKYYLPELMPDSQIYNSVTNYHLSFNRGLYPVSLLGNSIEEELTLTDKAGNLLSKKVRNQLFILIFLQGLE